ncbi:hypothetical protein MBLNU230_g1188t1 [Neophaeotheca triangularis]
MARGAQRLQGAIDTEVEIAVQRFLSNGVEGDSDALYAAIQKSNSSLKRKPKKVIQQSIERVLDFISAENQSEDSQAAIEKELGQPAPDTADAVNRSLRKNLAPPGTPNTTGEETNPAKKRKVNGESLPKRQKTGQQIKIAPPTDISIRDVGGVDDVIDRMKEMLACPLLWPEKYIKMGVKPPSGILLHGPPGCGKTLITRACAATLRVPFIELLGPSVVSGMSGESEKGIRDRFEEAKKNAPCLIFIDEIDAIAQKRDTAQSQMERRIVAQLLVSMDELESDPTKPVIVIAATNRPDSLDPALRRGGRFDTEINLGVPNEHVRELILKTQTRNVNLTEDVDFKQLAKMTAGFVGADLKDLVGKAGSWQMSRFRETLEAEAQQLEETRQPQQPPEQEPDTMDLDIAATTPSETPTRGSASAEAFLRLVDRSYRQNELPDPPGFENDAITMAAFLAAFPSIIPSSKREGFATVPNVSWADIGALRSVREELQTAIVEPIKNPALYATIGIDAPTGVLLWGPPGCGKTLLAKAVAAESKANFISIKGPELLNKYVGESERAVRQVFNRARSSVPCVIFFDELDALVPRRDDSLSEASARVVNTLLTELDGLDTRAGIYVIGATNRPDMIDEAMMRPGRLETPLFVDLPGPEERVEILKTVMRSKPVEEPEGVLELMRRDACHGYSGADIESLMRKAGQAALKRRDTVMRVRDFEVAVGAIKGSVGSMERYRKLRARFEQKS